MARVGSCWAYASHCGSRSFSFGHGPLDLYSDISARGSNTANEWKDQYDDNDDGDSLGRGYARTIVCIVGGNWFNSVNCGSRGSHFDYGPQTLGPSLAARHNYYIFSPIKTYL